MPDVTKFNTLTFDCYGTLIDWERGIHAELRPWLDRHGRRDLDDNTLLETFGTIEAACEAETPGKLYPEILAEVHRRLADKWSIKATAAFGLIPIRASPAATARARRSSLEYVSSSGSASPESATSPGWVAAISVNTVLWRRHSDHSAGVE